MKPQLMIILFFFACNWASASIRSGLNSSPLAVQYIMADPPLPAILSKNKQRQLSLKPGYIFGDFTGEYQNLTERGSMTGPTLGSSYTHALNKKWAFYGWFVGSRMTGDASTTYSANGAAFSNARDIDVSFLNISTGLSYLLYSDKDSNSFVSLFGGAYIPIYRFNQNYSTASTNGANFVNADIEANHSFYGLLLGIQWKKNIHEKWNIGSHFILADTFGSGAFMNPFGDSGECKQFNITKLNTGSASSIQEVDPECAGGANNEFWFDTQIGGIGMSVEYIPWSMNVNLVSPFLNRYIFDLFYEEMQPEFIYLSFTWDVL